MKSIDHNLLHNIQKDKLNWESIKLYIKILKERFIVELWHNRIKKSIKINTFNRLYHIPKSLIEIFDIKSYKPHQDKLRSLINNQINDIKSQPTDWHDELYIKTKLLPELKLIDKSVEDIIKEYILDRIYHTSLPDLYQHFEKDRSRIIMISEELKSNAPDLHIIFDTIIKDICDNFSVKSTVEYKPYKKEKNKKLLKHMGHSNKELEEIEQEERHDNYLEHIWYFEENDEIDPLIQKQNETRIVVNTKILQEEEQMEKKQWEYANTIKKPEKLEINWISPFIITKRNR